MNQAESRHEDVKAVSDAVTMTAKIYGQRTMDPMLQNYKLQ